MASAPSQDRSGASNTMTTNSALYSYGMAVAATAVAAGLTLGLRYSANSPTFFIFYAAIFISIWFYGRGPGWLATALACVATLPLFPDQSSGPTAEAAVLPARLPTVVAFILCATAADWISTRRHRTEAALRAARDGLEQTVLERTHALRDANQRLSAEIEVRRRVETELRTSEEWWRKIFETSNVPIGVTDLKGHHLMVNRATERTLGYTLEELRHLTIAELTHEDDRARTLPAFDALAQGTRGEYHVVKRYRCKDGGVKWLDATVTRLQHPRSGEDVIVAIVADITEQKRTEAELRGSEERWRRVFEGSAVPMALVDCDRRVVAANPACEKLLCYSHDEFSTMSALDFYAEGDREVCAKDLDSLESGEHEQLLGERRLQRKDGELLWVNASISYVPSTETTPALFPVVIEDVTQRKRAETALRASEERWRAMFAHAPTAIAMVGADYRLMETNPACHRMLGYSEDEFRQLTPMDLCLDDDREVSRLLLPQLIDGTRESARTEKRYRTKDGGLVWADATFFHVPATEGSPGFATAIVFDITERKRTEEALRRTQSELARAARIMSMGELTASIAHEVNQPLAAIVASGNACRRWLAMEPANMTRARESLNRIVEDANRASEVITRVRAHTKNTLPEQAEVWINDIVEDVLFLTRGELEARLIIVQMELDRDVAPVLGDKVQLQQVMLNLVMNAVEAMTSITDRQRVLTMKSHTVSPTEVQIMVRDNGPGLNGRDNGRIFDTFFTTKPDGMGMGLSISRSIIEAHSGRLWTLPASPHGAEFHFALPALRAHES